jgi:hypothetical protein
MMERFERRMQREFLKAWLQEWAWVFFTLAGAIAWLLSR